MCFLSDLTDRDKLTECLETFIFSDPGMRENNMQDIRLRVTNTFASERYISRLSGSGKNWLNMDIPAVLDKIISFLNSL